VACRSTIQSLQGSMVGCNAYEATVYAGRGQKDRKVSGAGENVACRDCHLWRIALGSSRDKLIVIR
jgi:hypothetical protein